LILRTFSRPHQNNDFIAAIGNSEKGRYSTLSTLKSNYPLKRRIIMPTRKKARCDPSLLRPKE